MGTFLGVPLGDMQSCAWLCVGVLVRTRVVKQTRPHLLPLAEEKPAPNSCADPRPCSGREGPGGSQQNTLAPPATTPPLHTHPASFRSPVANFVGWCGVHLAEGVKGCPPPHTPLPRRAVPSSYTVKRTQEGAAASFSQRPRMQLQPIPKSTPTPAQGYYRWQADYKPGFPRGMVGKPQAPRSVPLVFPPAKP